MLSQEEENLLEKWLINILRQYHLQNAETIAKFVITLIKKETDDPYAHCFHELEATLKTNTEEFLNNLFQVLDDGSYKYAVGDNDYEEEEVYDEERHGLRRQESSTSNVHGSPTGSDGDDSYERRQRFRRRDSDGGEVVQQSRHSSSVDESSHNFNQGNARSSGSLQSSRNDPDHREYNNNRQFNNRRNNGGNNNNNNYYQQRGNRNDYQHNNNYKPHNQHYQQQPQNIGAPPSYPTYPSYGQPYGAAASYPYDPTSASANYYGYPAAANWSNQPHGTAAPPYPYGATAGGYYYGAGYAPPPTAGQQPSAVPSAGAGYGYMAAPTTAEDTAATEATTDKTNETAVSTVVASQPAAASNATGLNIANTATSVPSPSHAASGNALHGGYSAPGVYPTYQSPGHGGYQSTYPSYQPQPHQGNRQQHRQHLQAPRESNKANRPAVKNLPEHERCTLRCTSIPVHVTEEDLKAHFESFGHVVELQVSPMEANASGGNEEDETEDSKKKKKAANECLVQFHSAANARRCLSCELPVLNNRFIFIYQSHFNIIPPQDVPRPSRDVLDRDAYLLAQKEIIPAVSAAQAAASRKRTALNIYTSGMTNKWRRTDSGKEETKVPGEAPAATTSTENGGVEGEHSMTNEDKNEAEVTGPVATLSAASKAAAEEMKASLLRQKQLKQQAEELLKKKEDVLINQIEKCRTMMEKLEKAPDGESKAKNLQYLEDKIVDLQSQLRAVREQVHQQQQSAAAGTSSGDISKVSPAGAGPGGFFRGGGGGRFAGRRGGRVWGGPGRFGGRFPGRYSPRPLFAPQNSFHGASANMAAGAPSGGASYVESAVAVSTGVATEHEASHQDADDYEGEGQGDGGYNQEEEWQDGGDEVEE